jgi:hypothetical protein
MDLWDIIMTFLAIAVGIGIMGFGLFIFYAFLPLLYALWGFGLGTWIGSLFTGSTSGFLPVVLGIALGAVMGLAAYGLKPFVRMLLGLLGGATVGLAIASAFAWGPLLSIILAVVGAGIGFFVVPLFMDPFIIVVSAIGGSALLMDGVNKLLPNLALSDRSLIASGSFLPLIVWIVLTAVGLGWQFKNIGKWINRAVRDEVLAG